MPFKILITVYSIHSKPVNFYYVLYMGYCIVYFKYRWKTPEKNVKKVLENPRFFNYEDVRTLISRRGVLVICPSEVVFFNVH